MCVLPCRLLLSQKMSIVPIVLLLPFDDLATRSLSVAQGRRWCLSFAGGAGWLADRRGPMLQARRRLGDFEIIRLLGRGGMGEVYEAQQWNPPRRVALKVLAPWLAEDEEILQRFWREAAVPAQLDHPSIVRIISTGKTDEGLAFFTMQLIRGLSLA